MTTLSYAIVDDDTISLKTIEQMAEKTNFLHKQASFTSSSTAMHWLADNPLDLLFLNAKMTEYNGIELLQSLTYKPEIIFMSEKISSAIDAFEFSAIDFLLMPLKDFNRFLSAINKVVNRKTINSVADENLFIRTNSLLLKLRVEDIDWVEAYGDYIKIQTGDQVHTIYSTLKKIQDKLPSDKFIRVHRSFIINLSKICNIDHNNLEINKKIIPISGSYKENLLNKINIL